MTYLDLFSGYNGFALALQQAGWHFDKHIFSEIDQYAIANTKHNFPNAKYGGRIEFFRKYLKHFGITRADLVTFGWPCQDNSIAGNRKGQTDGTRSGLLSHAIKVVRYTKPRNFIAENVEGLRTVNKGIDIVESLKVLAYLHESLPQYDIEVQLVNTLWWLPQNRERLFFVGHLREGRRSGEVFPIGNCFGPAKAKNIQPANSYSGTLNTKNNSGQLSVDSGTVLVVANAKGQIFGSADKAHAGTLTGGGNSGGNHSDMTIVVVNDRGHLREVASANTIDANYHKGMDNHAHRSLVLSKNYERGKSQGARVYTEDSVATTLSSSQGGLGASTGLYEIGDRVRRLTPLECERLQGLPEGWTKYGVFGDKLKEISDSQRYKLIGNGVSIPPVLEIATRLLQINQYANE